MNAADLARLQLARRAFKAAAPSVVEVQVGVRRARLALLRPRKARALVGKGLTVLVLAMSGLAYAKPQALRELGSELLGSASRQSAHATSKPGASPAAAPPRPASAPQPASEQQAASARQAASEQPTPPLVQSAPETAAVAEPLLRAAAAKPSARSGAATARVSASEWGEVAQALARGDEASALASLGSLSHSEDPRTRDKADLGRAQLLLSRGDRDNACALARSLLQRPIDSRLARQTRAFLNECVR